MRFKTMLLHTAVLLLFITNANSQITITDKIDVENTSIKNQQKTGTCWSFATTSFLEAELIRMGKGSIDLSEMYNARKVYEDKALNYVLRHGKANFAQGSLAHDVTTGINKFGVIPQNAYNGLTQEAQVFDHNELSAAAKGFLDGVITNQQPSIHWPVAFNAILDVYLGEVPESFNWEGKKYTPKTFAESLGLYSENYMHFTSFTHHPYYEAFILEIPDNYSNGSFQNLPLNELMEVINNALEQGYSISWDGDVSEKTFSQNKGLATLPKHYSNDEWYTSPTEEMLVNQDIRQSAFMNYTTTDDHLMHLVGKATDQNGTTYYKIKNSWGEVGPYKGYLYMSEAYLKMKTVAITVHKNAVPKAILTKLK